MSNEQGRHDDAVKFCDRSLSIDEASFGADNSRLAWDLNCLGSAHLGRRNPKRAQESLQRAVALEERKTSDPTLLAESRFLLARALPAACA